MEKFKDIKVGEILIYERQIRVSYSKTESFFLKFKVIKVTPTQFVGDNGIRYRKDSGKEIGAGFFSKAYREGEKAPWSNKIVKDETIEMNKFLDRFKKVNSINRILKEIEITVDSSLSNEELFELENQFNELHKKLKQ